MMTPPARGRVTLPVITSWHEETGGLGARLAVTPASANLTTGRCHFYPIYLPEPFTVAKAFWCNGATAATDSVDVGLYQMTDQATGRLDLIRSTGAVLAAGASVVQESGVWRVAPKNITTGVDSTDATTYTTASVILKAGRLYLLSIVNTKAVLVDPVSSIAGGGTWTSRSGTDYNATIHRVSIWSCVPAVDYTGTIVITFGATQTGARWSLNEFSGVDTATTDGVVQNAVGAAIGTTPLATLAALGSANNAVFGALANTADSTTTPGSGFTELSDDSTASTPASFLQTEFAQNDTTVDGTITSGAWGACAVEIKADASPFIVPASTPGNPNVYLALSVSGTTTTFLRAASGVGYAAAAGGLFLASTFPLPSSCIPTSAVATNVAYVLCGLSSRSLIG